MEIIEHAAIFLLQIAAILISAKIGGEICVRWLKQPAVLGELIVGVIIGPFALGNWIIIPGHGALFPMPAVAAGIPVSEPLFIIAELAAVILLFMAGLETNLSLFMKYAGQAILIAAGGVIFPFIFGVYASVWFGVAIHWYDPVALFIGAIMTATSVGITARILGDIKKLDTPEGVTILAGAVVDDVFGIIILSVVVAVVKIEQLGGSVDLGAVGMIGVKAIGFWVVLMVVGFLISKPLDKLLRKFKSHGSILALSLALCFIASATAEFFGLAMIIGAYGMGLVLSRVEMTKILIKELESSYHFLVPIFFVVTGMLVNVRAFEGVVVFGIVLTLLAIIGKLFGCGLPALGLGFNKIGALRVGVGMVPRGEVALIVALVGISGGIITQKEYGVVIMMTLVTTLIAPILLGPLFTKGGHGTKKAPEGHLLHEVERVIVEELER